MRLKTHIRKMLDHFLLFTPFPGLFSFHAHHFHHFSGTYLRPNDPSSKSYHFSYFSLLFPTYFTYFHLKK